MNKLQIQKTKEVDDLNHQGDILRSDNPLKRLELGEKAYKLSLEINYRKGIAQSLLNIAVGKMGQSDYATALEKCEESLVLFQEEGDVIGIYRSLHSIGSLHRYLLNKDKSIDFLFKGLEVVEKAKLFEQQAVVLRDIGQFYAQYGDYTASLYYHNRALKIRNKIGDSLRTAELYIFVAVPYKEMGDYVSAVSYLTKGLETFSKLSNNTSTYGFGLNFLAEIHYALGDDSLALDNMFKALRVFEQVQNKHGMTTSLVGVGRVFSRIQNYSSSLQYYFTASAIWEANTQNNDFSKIPLARILNGIGEVYVKMDEYQKAFESFFKSLALSQEANSMKDTAQVLLNIGIVLTKLKKSLEAIEHLQKGLSIAGEMKSKMLIAQYHQALFEANKAIGNTSKGLEHEAMYMKLKDFIWGERDQKKIKDLFKQYDIKQIQNTIALSNLKVIDSVEAARILKKANENKKIWISATETSVEKKSSTRNVYVKTFGDFSVTINGYRLELKDWQRKRARDIFKILLLNYKKAVTTDELIELGWKDGNRQEIGGLVRTNISYIRKALEYGQNVEKDGPNQFIMQKDGAYTLDFGKTAFIDFIEFNQLITASLAVNPSERRKYYEEAVRIYTGDFLKENFYDEWSSYEREKMRDAYIKAALHLAEEYLMNIEETEKAIDLAQKVLENDKLNDKAYEVIILAYLKQHQINQAKKIYERSKQIFKEELGISPPENLLQLIEDN